MTFKQLAREICKREGKKQQVNIAQVSEVLRCLFDIINESLGHPGHQEPLKKRKR